MEFIKCNNCGSSKTKKYLTYEKNDQEFHLVQCTNCNLVYTNPRPKLNELIARTNYVKGKSLHEKKMNRCRESAFETYSDIIDFIIGHMDRIPNSAFDVGCGAGTFLFACKEKNIYCEGNEINPYSSEYLNNIGYKVYNLPTQQLQVQNKYDLIAMNDYIEHTHTPKQDIQWAHSRLKENGFLYIITMYLNCPDHRKLGKDWKYFGPAHIYYFYPYVLNDMIRNIGFEIINVKKRKSIIQILAKKSSI